MKNYKKISEIGLELIELEDQVLLVDPNEPCQEDDWIYWNKRVIKAIDTTYSKESKYIVASTKQLERILLLVIEDEVKDIVGENLKRICSLENYQDHPIGRYAKEALEEHEKAKETYKFTESDVLQLMYELFEYCQDGFFVIPEEVLKRNKLLTKKELWVEVELGGYFHENNTSFGGFIPKITNNQIKVIWK